MSNKKIVISVLLFLLVYSFFAFRPSNPVTLNQQFEVESSSKFIDIKGEYQPGEVLVKYETSTTLVLSTGKNSDKMMEQELSKAGISSFVKLGATNQVLGESQLSNNQTRSVWVKGYIEDDLTVIDVLSNLGSIPQVVQAEPNYIYYTAEDGEPEIVTDPLVSEQYYLDSINITTAQEHLESIGINPGGSRDVIVAVIDTGVDYLHEDLAPNMWVNSQEIAGNNIDDDNNGYIDDIYGVSTVSDSWFHSGNPMDDHGHGTHVAGIIAAKGGNGIGIEGVASNVRIMAIKASASSGIFLSSDIADGISYAYEKGADVINMSFGGYSKSYVVEDALAIAFSQAVLIAAAGNDAYINEPHPEGRDMFPAAYPWVVGVMASNNDWLASFSNFDFIPEDAHEYSIVAPGTYIMSTLPNNQYAKWSGTSMATPIVSGIAALLRSKFTDSGHNSRFIMGQLIGTATTPINIPEFYKLAYGVKWDFYYQVDAFKALTEVPKPNLSFYDFYVWDSQEVESTNQANGYVDSGELIELGLYIRNHWGQAKNTLVKIDAISPGGVADPYIEFITDTVDYGQVGSFSTDDNGFEYNEEDRMIGITNPFVIRVSPDTPNDYIVRFNVTITANNALDPLDENVYTTVGQTFTLTVRNGYILPNLIEEDTVLTNDKYYIIPNATRIEEGVTVTVEEGTKIQFWSGQPEDPYADKPITYLRVDGTLILRGTQENPIKIFPSEIMEGYEVRIYKGDGNAQIHMEYTEVMNPRIDATTISHSYFSQNTTYIMHRYLSQGVVYDAPYYEPFVYANSIDSSIFWKLGNVSYSSKFRLSGYVTNSLLDSNYMQVEFSGENNVFLNNFIRDMGYYQDQLYVSSGMVYYNQGITNISVGKIFRDEVTGTSYVQVEGLSQYDLAQRFARYLGGHLAVINSASENDFITRNISTSVNIGLKWESPNQGYQWVNQDELTYTNWLTTDSDSFRPYVYIDNIGKWQKGITSTFLIELTGDIYVNDITIDKMNLVLGHDSQPYQVNYDLVPLTANINDLEWYSMNENIVTVNQSGVITPVAIGQTTVLVRSKDGVISKEMNVSVIQTVPLEGINLFGVSQLNVDQTYKIPYTLEPFNTTELSFVWSSSDEYIATVDQVGKVTAHHPGTVTINVQNFEGLITDQITFTVVSPVKSIEFEQDYLVTWLNRDPYLLDITILPEDATNKTIIYESAAPDIAYVDEQGYLHAVSNGSVVIRATAQYTNIYTEMIVTVTDESIANLKFIDVETIGNGDYLRFYALSDQGTVWNWGREEVKLPQQVTGLSHIIDMSLSNYDGYFLSSLGKLYRVTTTWRGNNIEEIELPFSDGVKVERASYNNQDYLLILRNDGTVWGYGNNTNGELPGVYVENSSEFVQLDISQVIDMIAIYQTSVYLKSDGTVHYSGKPESYAYTTMIADLSNIVSIERYESWDYGYAMFIARDIYDNFYRVYISESYVQVEKIIYKGITSKVIDHAESYGYHKLSLTVDGKVFASGYNGYGQLGIGNTISYYDQYIDTGLTNIKKVITTYYNSVALSNDGQIYVWGVNYQYNVGDLTTYNRTRPAQPLIGFEYDMESPMIETTNILGSVDFGINDSIIIDYHEAIKPHLSFMSIKLLDGNNNPISIQRSVQLDKLIIDPVIPLQYGETYTLILVQDAVVDYFANGSGFAQYAFKTEDGLNFNRTNYRIDINDEPVLIDYVANENWNESISFSSNNEAVATVDGQGYITPVSLGFADITISSESGNYQWIVHVEIIHRIPITSIAIIESDFSLIKGQTKLVTLDVNPTDYNEDIIWSSSDETVATVDEFGFVKGLKDGTVTITVTSLSGLYNDQITVTVIEPVEDIDLGDKYVVLNLVDGTYQLNALISPTTATDQSVNWLSSNESIATVDQNGLVSLHQSGQVVIRAISLSSNIYEDIHITIPDEDLSQIDFIDVQSVLWPSQSTVYGLTNQGTVYRWGYNHEIVPTLVPGLSNIVKMSAAYNMAMFLNSSGDIYYLYHYYQTPSYMPTGITEIIDMSTNEQDYQHTLLLKNDGTVWGRGENNFGQLTGIGFQSSDEFIQLQGIANIKEVVALNRVSVYLNIDGQVLYSGGTSGENVANQVTGLPQITSIERKDMTYNDAYKILAIDINGNYHEVDFSNTSLGVTVTSIDLSSIPERVVQYQANDFFQMALTEQGNVYVKGNNQNGQYGNGTYFDYYGYEFVQSSISGVSKIFIERTAAFAILDNGDLYGWGNNGYGALGINNQSDQYLPKKVLLGFEYDSIVPMIINQHPLDNSQGFIISDNIVIQFNEKIGEAYNLANVKLYDSKNNQVSVNKAVGINTITIDPLNALRYGEDYRLVLPAGAVVDHFGLGNEYHEIQFETEYGVNFTRSNYRIDIKDLPTQIEYMPNPEWTQNLIFTSLNPEIATVDSLGVVTPVTLGITDILVESEDGLYEWLIRIEVIDRISIETMNFSEDHITINTNETEKLNLSITPINYNEDIIWTSSDSLIASVDEFGFIKGLKNGTVTITATSAIGNILDTLLVTVIEPVTAIETDEEFIVYNINDEPMKINVSIYPEEATNKNIIWQSGNPNIAYVDSDGYLQALTKGTVIVRGTAENTNLFVEIVISISDEISHTTQFIDTGVIGYEDNIRVYALTNDGNIWYWGRDNAFLPQRIPNLTNVVQVSFSTNSGLALTSTGAVYEIYPNGPSNSVNLMNTNIENITYVSKNSYGYDKNLLVKNDGTVWANGNNYYGELGSDTFDYISQFIQIDSLANIKQAIALYRSTVFLDHDGNVYYLGYPGEQIIPQQIDNLPQIINIKRSGVTHWGHYIVIAEDIDGNFYTLNFDSNPININTISPINGESIVDYTMQYGESYFAVTETGVVYAKGNNSYGQLGIGNTDNKEYFVPVDLPNVEKIFAYGQNTIAITQDGDLYIWGRNSSRQIGDLSSENRLEPFMALVGLTIDEQKPTLETCTPSQNAVGIDVNQEIILDFNEGIRPNQQYTTIQLFDSNNKLVSITKNLVLDKLYITPVNSLRYGENYRLVVNYNAVMDYFMNGNDAITINFKTKEGVSFSRTNYRIDILDDATQVEYTTAIEWDQPLVFESSNENIFTVNQTGEITPVSLGVAQLNVRTEDSSYAWQIQVEIIEIIPITSIDITQTEMTISKNNNERIMVNVLPLAYNEDVIWSSSDLSVATVNQYGFVTGIKSGTATITVSSVSGLFSDTILVNVIEPVDSIGFNPNEIVIGLSETSKQAVINIYPETATNKTILWESANPAIVTVDENGILVPISIGKTIIRARAQYTNLYADLIVNVTDLDINNIRFTDAMAIGYGDQLRFYGLTDSGEVWYWGMQQGDYPKRLSITNVIQMAPGFDYGYLLTSTGIVYKVNRTDNVLVNPSIIDTGITGIESISTSNYGDSDHTLIVKNDGSVWGTGSNDYGQLSSVPYLNVDGFVQLEGLLNIKQAIALNTTSVFLNQAGQVFYSGNPNQKGTATLIPGISQIETIESYGNYYMDQKLVIAKDIDGVYYQINFGGNAPQVTAVDLTQFTNVKSYTEVQDSHKLVITENNEVYASGYNYQGQLGNGNRTNSYYTYVKTQINDVIKVIPTRYNSLAITATGEMYVWGYNNYYQTLNSGNYYQLTPFKVLIGRQKITTAPIVTHLGAEHEGEIKVDDSLVITFDQAIQPDYQYANIKLFNQLGSQISITKAQELNKIIVTPLAPLKYGETYSLVVPSGAVNNYFGYGNNYTSLSFETEKAVTFERSTYRIDINDLPTSLVYTRNISFTDGLLFESDNPEVVTVDQDGIMTPIAMGNATIRVYTDSGYEWFIFIEIIHRIPIDSIDILESNLVVNKGQKVRADIIVTPVDYNEDTIWTSSDPLVASVDEFGFITGHMNGTVTIQVESLSGLFSDTISVTVIEPVESITYDEQMIIMTTADDPLAIVLNIYPTTATNKNIIWRSSNENVAYFDLQGKLTPRNAGTVMVRGQAEYSDIYIDLIVSVSESITELPQIKDVATNYYDNKTAVFAVTTSGELWTWGQGYLGRGISNDKAPAPVSLGITDVKSVESRTSEFRTSIVKNDGTVWSIGYEYASGNGSYGEFTFSQASYLTDIDSVSLGVNFTLALKNDGTVWAWGYNSYGQLGDGSTTERSRPIQVNGIENAVKVVASHVTSYVLTQDGTVYQFGYGASSSPTICEELSNLNIKDIVARPNQHYIYILTQEGEVIEYSDSNHSSNYMNFNIDSNLEISRLDYGYAHLMMLMSDGTIRTSGRNYEGQLGHGVQVDYIDRYYPVIPDIQNVSQVIAGYYNSFAIDTSGNLYGWGLNSSGQLADFTYDNSYVPKKIFFGSIADSFDPIIQSTAPIQNGIDFAVNGSIEIQFDEAIRQSNNFSTIYLFDQNNNIVSIQKIIDWDKIVITPTSPLQPNTNYRLEISDNAVMDVFGNTFGYYSLNFTTEVEATGLETIIPDAINDRHYWTNVEVRDAFDQFVIEGHNATFYNNAILNNIFDLNTDHWMRFFTHESDNVYYYTNNYWGTSDDFLVNKQIIDFNDYQAYAEIKVDPYLTEGNSSMYPFVTDVLVGNEAETDARIVGAEPITITVLFNRDMDMTEPLRVFFGPDYPYTDYQVPGEWVDARTWLGNVEITPLTGDGKQYFRIRDAYAADDKWLWMGDDDARFMFEINSFGAEAMALQASGGEGEIELTWMQDEFETLAGYNMYRSTSISGEFRKINTSLISSDVLSYSDYQVEPGVAYFYKFTIVKTDLTESAFSNVAFASAYDVIPPQIFHSPVISSNVGTDLLISATAYDNIKIESMTLYYRVINTETYQSMPMLMGTNNRYTGTISSTEAIVPGIEYYIEVSDGRTTVSSGTAATPYTVRIEDNPTITSISPNRGLYSGNTDVTISGLNFKEGAKVYFSNIEGLFVNVIDENTITVKTPAYNPQYVNVRVVNPDGSSHVIYNGFQFYNDDSMLIVGNTTVAKGEEVTVPIRIENSKGLVALDIDIEYDVNALSFISLSKTTMTDRFVIATNSSTNGKILLSMASDTSISGSGDILVLKFMTYINAPVDVTSINITKVNANSINDGVGIVNGTVTFSTVYNFSGMISYFGNGSIVPGVTVKLESDDQIYTSISSLSDGSYSFNGIMGGNYSLSASKEGQYDSITAYDASLILRHVVQAEILTNNYQLIAADVNEDGYINSMDAAFILQYLVGMQTLPFEGSSSAWKFIYPQEVYAGIGSSQYNQNIIAVLLGDVSGNYNPTSSLDTTHQGVISIGQLMNQENEIRVPIYLEYYNYDLFSFETTIIIGEGTTVKDIIISSQLEEAFTVFNQIDERTIKVAVASSTALDLVNPVLDIIIEKNSDSIDTVQFNLTNTLFNEFDQIIELKNVYRFVYDFDTNDNGVIDEQDIMNFIINYNQSYQYVDISHYDINRDGIVDIFDIIAVSRYE